MILKEDMMNYAETLPSETELEEILDSIILLNKIDNGLKESESGDVLTLDEVKAIVSKW